MRTLFIAVAVALVAGVAPAVAGAKLRPIPPSNPAANQYVEPVPTAGGSKPTTTLKLHPGHSTSGGTVPGTPAGGGAVPAATGRALVKSGTTGVKAAIFAQATAPAARSHRTVPAGVGGGEGGGSTGAGASSGSGHASSPTMAVVRSVTGLDGVGAALPLVLIVLALAISGLAVYRRATTN